MVSEKKIFNKVFFPLQVYLRFILPWQPVPIQSLQKPYAASPLLDNALHEI